MFNNLQSEGIVLVSLLFVFVSVVTRIKHRRGRSI